jgi:hypothetical protein
VDANQTDQPRAGEDQEWLSLPEAAVALGIHIDTLRRKVRHGQIEARKVPTKFGESYQVRLTGVDEVDPDLVNPGSMGGPTPIQAPPDPALSELIQLVGKLQDDNREAVKELQAQMVEKAEAAAMWQARAEMLSFQLQGAQETIRMLEAPKHQATEAVVVPESAQEPLETADSGVVVSESKEERREPWWRRFWQLVSV